MEEFIKACQNKIRYELALVYKPGMPKLLLYSAIMRQILNMSLVHGVPIRKYEMIEFADDEFKIKINHTIQFYIIPTERRKSHD
jgi:hypothetical protein